MTRMKTDTDFSGKKAVIFPKLIRAIRAIRVIRG